MSTSISPDPSSSLPKNDLAGSLRVEDSHHLRMQTRVRGHCRFCVYRIPPVPVGDHPPSTSDHRNKRGGIPRMHDRITHDVRPSAGDRKISVAITPGADHPHSPGERLPTFRILMACNVERIGRKQCGFRQGFCTAYVYWSAIQRGRHCITHNQLPQDRLVDATEYRLPAVQQGDQGAEEGARRGKAPGAINRIERPNKFRVDPIRTILLAKHAVGWESPRNQPAHEFFRAAIDGSYRGLVAFPLDSEFMIAEKGADEVTACLRQLDQKSAVICEVHEEEV